MIFGAAHLSFLVLAESSSDSSFGSIGYIFLLSGFVFYAVIFLKYRNVGKRHKFETETEATKLNLQPLDERIESKTGLKNSRMSGANNTKVDGAGGFPFSMGQLTSLTDKLNPMFEQMQKHSGEGPSDSNGPV